MTVFATFDWVRGYRRAEYSARLVRSGPPARPWAYRFKGWLLRAQRSQHRLPHVRKWRTMQRLKDFAASYHWLLGATPCQVGRNEFDHDWQYISDWYGDPDVINGTADCSFHRCRTCGEENHEMPAPEPWDDYDL